MAYRVESEYLKGNMSLMVDNSQSPYFLDTGNGAEGISGLSNVVTNNYGHIY